MNYKAYLKRVLSFTEDDVWGEIKRLCVESGIEPRSQLIFKDSGGLTWVIDHFASTLYLNLSKVNNEVRVCLSIISIVNRHSRTFQLNEQVNEADSEWDKSRLKKELVEGQEKVSIIVAEKALLKHV
jgi:hypothetical protein